VKHYIIIEVRERDITSTVSDMAMIRRNLHQFILAKSINAADCVVRGDKATIHQSMWAERSHPETNPFQATKDLFERAMGGRWKRDRETLGTESEIGWDPNGRRD
jgi:hypothetical protein